MVKEKIEIDLTGFRSEIVPNYQTLLTNIMTEAVIAVPRSALNLVQLFMMPFCWQVWTIVILILVMVEILHLTSPLSFRNDPIMLVLCGYESFTLHRAERREKFLLLPLIVLMFFVTCAYETKLLALMTSKPASRNIRTIAELVESGIKIKADLLTDIMLTDNPTIRESIVNSTVDFFNLDLVHAYILKATAAKFLVSRYFDPDQRLHRYALLDEAYTVEPIVFILRS